MLPNFKPGRKVVVQKKWFFCSLGLRDVIVLKDPRNRKLILKRIKEIKNSHPERSEASHFINVIPDLIRDPFLFWIPALAGMTRHYFVLGDNKQESTDSKSFGWVTYKNIIGKVILQA